MKRITDESDLIEKKGAIEDDGDEFVGSSKAFKNHQEEKEFEDKLEKQFRDEGMDYDKIIKRIEAEKAKRNIKGRKLGYEDQLDIVRDELNTRGKSHGLDSRKSECTFDNSSLDYQMFIKQMNLYRDQQHDVLFFPSNHSHGNKTFTR